MSLIKYLLLSYSILVTATVFSQNQVDENQTKIATVLENYFDLEREAIHIHLNKSTFLNNETIWYQGYVINRKTNKPYFTTNVFVLLFDENGKQVSDKLIYASNGVFTGKIELDSKLSSGNYYIQAYTNWMNNFSENESTITKISIINPSEGIKNYKKLNTESLELFLTPEGKSLISDISNTIGIQLKDCRGNSPESSEANIQNSKGEILKTIKLNRFGYGKFDIVPTNEIIKVVVNYNTRVIEKTLQTPDLIGVSLEANAFSIDNKTAIKIKTNPKSYDVFQSKKLHLVIHQDQKLTVYPLQFKPDGLEETFIVDNASLQEGINTIRIIDNDLKQWSERLIYINPLTRNPITVLKNNRKEDKINLIGYSNYPNSKVSISVVPEDSKSKDENNSIVAGITINPYLNKPLENCNYYLNAPNRLKLYELDLALLNEGTTKYNWNYLKNNVPVSNYSFDVGLELKGAIDIGIKDKSSYKVNLVIHKDMLALTSDVTENGAYKFEHLLLTDSTFVNLSLQKLPDFTNVPYKLTPQTINRKRTFNKPFSALMASNCISDIEYQNLADFELPKFDSKIIKLDEVVIKKKKLSELKHGNDLSNSMLRGYKIDQSNNHGPVLNFIEYHGFVVVRNLGTVKISSRQRTSLNMPDPTPLVYINGRQLFSSFDELAFMQMSEIEEIYIDSRAIVASMNNNAGIIKIYTKTAKSGYFSKQDPNSLIVKEGFSPNSLFKNEDYESTQSNGFNNFGVIGWTPLLKCNDKGDFMLDVIDYNKSKCYVIIEGMTDEGKVFHEEKIVELK